jgi:hypothetical protein
MNELDVQLGSFLDQADLANALLLCMRIYVWCQYSLDWFVILILLVAIVEFPVATIGCCHPCSISQNSFTPAVVISTLPSLTSR